MAEPFLGEIRNFAFGLLPSGWLPCNGQLLPINQNQVLFSILGTQYGGNGTVNFALPDLRGRTPISFGNGLGLPAYTQGQVGGEAAVTLSTAQLPVHYHTVNGSSSPVSSGSPSSSDLLGTFPNPTNYVSPSTKLVAMANNTVGNAGSGQPHVNMQPTLALNLCIAIQGIYPSRS